MGLPKGTRASEDESPSRRRGTTLDQEGSISPMRVRSIADEWFTEFYGKESDLSDKLDFKEFQQFLARYTVIADAF
jgi:hypothetical protein